MPKHKNPTQQMSQDDFLKFANAIPLFSEWLARPGKTRYYKILLGSELVGLERSKTPHEAMARAHENAVMHALESNMPNSLTWSRLAPLPSAIAVAPYPKLRDQLSTILTERRKATV